MRFSHPVLKATLKGIERRLDEGPGGKDPIFPCHLKKIVSVMDVENDIEVLIVVAALLMFRTLLRVSHVVKSPHTLRVRDVEFLDSCCVLTVHFVTD